MGAKSMLVYLDVSTRDVPSDQNLPRNPIVVLAREKLGIRFFLADGIEVHDIMACWCGNSKASSPPVFHIGVFFWFAKTHFTIRAAFLVL